MNFTQTEAAILKVEHQLISAMKNCDVNQLDALLHEDLFFIIPSGQTITKAGDIENYRSGNMKLTEIHGSDQQIKLFGDTAVVALVVKMEGSFLDHPLDGNYKIIRVWKSFDNCWKVIAGSSTVIAAN